MRVISTVLTERNCFALDHQCSRTSLGTIEEVCHGAPLDVPLHRSPSTQPSSSHEAVVTQQQTCRRKVKTREAGFKGAARGWRVKDEHEPKKPNSLALS
ncbi:MAG: hypothetical protein QOJ95_478 [Mycobacterium sp.]|nr:hypothetical protein [Mycobacterium sp.]